MAATVKFDMPLEVVTEVGDFHSGVAPQTEQPLEHFGDDVLATKTEEGSDFQ